MNDKALLNTIYFGHKTLGNQILTDLEASFLLVNFQNTSWYHVGC